MAASFSFRTLSSGSKKDRVAELGGERSDAANKPGVIGLCKKLVKDTENGGLGFGIKFADLFHKAFSVNRLYLIQHDHTLGIEHLDPNTCRIGRI